ncbi:MAG: hypothetical protein Q9164_005304, partial [Protoblastenia rupestris]
MKLTLESVTSLKSLSCLLEDSEDVPRLYDKNYRSVRWVTLKSEEFKKQMVQAGMKTENALKVDDCAKRIDCWNEHLWLSLMRARRAETAIIESPKSNKERGMEPDDESDLLPPSRNNLTDIFRLEDVACEECCSVISLSAYFADLLLLLSKTTLTGKNPTAEEDTTDLRKLEVTCANALTTIPYVHLVNEVLQSFIRYKNRSLLSSPSGQQDLIYAFNTPVSIQQDGFGEEHSAGPVYWPGNTDYEVYSNIISKQMFALTCFPRDVVVQHLATLQLHPSEFIENFQAPELILQKLPDEKRGPVAGDLSLRPLRAKASTPCVFKDSENEENLRSVPTKHRSQSCGTSLQLTAAILEGAKELRKSLSSLFTDAIPTSESVVECAARNFDAATSRVVVGVVKGPQIQLAAVSVESKENLDKLMGMCKEWPKGTSVIPAIDKKVYGAELRLSGVLSTANTRQIISDSKELPS